MTTLVFILVSCGRMHRPARSASSPHRRWAWPLLDTKL
jgi:hypothetical protein